MASSSRPDSVKSTWETEYSKQFEWKTVFERPSIRKPYLYPAPKEQEISEDQKSVNPSSLSSRFRKLSKISHPVDTMRNFVSRSPSPSSPSSDSNCSDRSAEMTLQELESRGRSKSRRSDKPLNSKSKKVPIERPIDNKEDDEEEEYDPQIVNNILNEAQRTLRKSRSSVPPRDIIQAELLLEKYSKPFQTEYNDSFSVSQRSLLRNLVEPYQGESELRDSGRLSRRFQDISLDREQEISEKQLKDLLKIQSKERKTLKRLKKLEKKLLKKSHDEGVSSPPAAKKDVITKKISSSKQHGNTVLVTNSSGKLAKGEAEGPKSSFDYKRTFSLRRNVSPPPPRNIFHGVSNASVKLDAYPTFERIARRTVKPAHHAEKRHYPALQSLDQTVEVFYPSKYVFQDDWKR